MPHSKDFNPTEEPNEYVLVEAQETPLVRNVQMEGDHWDRLGEFEVS